MTPGAIIFDMDDTLVATAGLWRAAEEALLGAIGAPWSEELSLQYKGMNVRGVSSTIHRLLQPTIDAAACERLMREALLAGFERGPIQAMPGAVQCVRRAATIAPLAVASGSPLPAIERSLDALGIGDAFDVVISSESVSRGKPHPDVFLAAAEQLGVPADRCLVFEDSYVGVQAARAAQMACFAVPSSHRDRILTIATRVFDDLADVTAEDLHAHVTRMRA